MYCSSCGHPNAEGAKFCESCGKPMSAGTSSPGVQVRPSANASVQRAPAPKGSHRWLIVGGIVVVLAIVGVLGANLVSRISDGAQNDPQTVAETFLDRVNQQDVEGAMKMLCLRVSANFLPGQTPRDAIKQSGPITYKTRDVKKTDAGGVSRTHVYLDVNIGQLGSVADVTTKQTDGKWCIEDITLQYNLK